LRSAPARLPPWHGSAGGGVPYVPALRTEDYENAVSYCFRIRFHLSYRVRIHSDAEELALPARAGSGESVILQSATLGKVLREAAELLLIGRCYASEPEAQGAGVHWRGTVQKALASLTVGADFGDREEAEGASRQTTEDGVRWIEDTFGVTVFRCEPWPRFPRLGSLTARTEIQEDRLLKAIGVANARGAVMSDTERLAYDLYSASFAEPSVDAQFVMRMMAVETLLDPAPRPAPVLEHVNDLIAQTQKADLPDDEVPSLVGSLKWLREESISRAGQNLAGSLQHQQYMSEPPIKFFRECYDVRSRLVHGAVPRPSRSDVATRAEALRVFVGDLLSRELLG
jgi:hypothetical protein